MVHSLRLLRMLGGSVKRWLLTVTIAMAAALPAGVAAVAPQAGADTYHPTGNCTGTASLSGGSQNTGVFESYSGSSSFDDGWSGTFDISCTDVDAPTIDYFLSDGDGGLIDIGAADYSVEETSGPVYAPLSSSITMTPSTSTTGTDPSDIQYLQVQDVTVEGWMDLNGYTGSLSAGDVVVGSADDTWFYVSAGPDAGETFGTPDDVSDSGGGTTTTTDPSGGYNPTTTLTTMGNSITSSAAPMLAIIAGSMIALALIFLAVRFVFRKLHYRRRFR